VSLPEPELTNLSVEEALSLLAFGRSFAPSDFALAEHFGMQKAEVRSPISITSSDVDFELEQRRNDLEKLQQDRLRLTSEWESTRPTPTQVVGDGDSSTAKLAADLAYMNWTHSRPAALFDLDSDILEVKFEIEALAHFESDRSRATGILAQMAAACDGAEFGSPEFQSFLQRAQSHLWNAVCSETVTARGKLDPGALAWQQIPPDWFEHAPEPICCLGQTIVERIEGPTGLVPKWHEVSFKRSEIEALRGSLLSEAASKSQSSTDIAVAVDSGTKPNKGGRPTEYDWDSFWAEIVRRAELDGLPQKPDGTLDRPKLQDEMLQWCALKWGKEPGVTSIKIKLAKIVI